MIAADTRSQDGRWSLALLIITVSAVVRLFFGAVIPVFPDETYYWDWSRHLAAGYFDHPPVLALLIRLGTIVLRPIGASATPLAVRIGAIGAGWVAALATAAIARRLGGNTGALRAAIIISVLPLAAAGLILATPDAPVLATTAVGLYCVVRALEFPPRSANSLRWWSAAGVALGVAFSSKYTSIFLPVAVVVATATHPDLRPRWREAGPYVACILAAVVFAPVLVWNARHGWISFTFQLHHGLSAPQGSALGAAWRHEGDFFGGQAALASPILFVLLGVATGRALSGRQPAVRFLLATVAALSFGFFIYSALRQRVEPNWPAPAYIPAIVLAATTQWTERGRRWLWAAIGLAGAMSALIYAQAIVPVLPLAPAKDPIARAFGWRDLTVRAERVAAGVSDSVGGRTWLGADRYQEASELAFHARSQPVTFSLNVSGRRNQYDLWPRFADQARPGDNLVLVLDESEGTPGPIGALLPYFASVRRSDLVLLTRRGREIGRRRLWVLIHWSGAWPASAPLGLPGGSI